MADLPPPRSTGGEREVLLSLLQFQRESFVRKVTGVSDDDARRRLVPSDTTLLWLARHLAFAEHIWLVRRFAGEADDLVTPEPEHDTLHAAVAAYEAMWVRVDAIVGAADLDDLGAETGHASPVNLRWILAHLLEETARHAGHADILRELIDGATGR